MPPHGFALPLTRSICDRVLGKTDTLEHEREEAYGERLDAAAFKGAEGTPSTNKLPQEED